MFICSIILENYIISEISGRDTYYLLGCLAHYISFYFFQILIINFKHGKKYWDRAFRGEI